jgi:hypothetical protein
MMKFLLALSVSLVVALPVAATDVGVSISIGQPGFYGHIDIGRLPAPPLIFPKPIIIQHPPVAVAPPPVYLRVPPGHERDWGKHCRKYDACGRPVYFVRDDWYNNVYSKHHREHRGGDRDYRRDDRRDDRDYRRDDRDDRDDRHSSRGHPGKGHGKGRRDD